MSIQFSFSQEPDSKQTFKPPKLIIEFSGSYSIPTGSSKGDIEDFFKFKNYGTTYGLGFHFAVKYAANKKGTLMPFVNIGMTQLQNDDDKKLYIDSSMLSGPYPLPGSAVYGSAPGSSLLIIRCVHAGAGLQYALKSNSSIIPFGGAELSYSHIWGYYSQAPEHPSGTKSEGLETFNINGASRFGFALGIGANYRITKSLGFVLGTKYRFENLIGKNSEVSLEKNKMNLLDASAKELNTNLSGSRNIEYIEFYLGFALFIGINK